MKVKDFLERSRYKIYKIETLEGKELHDNTLSKEEANKVYGENKLRRIGCRFNIFELDKEDTCVLYI